MAVEIEEGAMKKTVVSLAFALAAVAVPLAGSASAGSGTMYTYRLAGPSVAAATVFDEHHQPGDTIRVTGSGTFDTATGAITGGGAFTHLNADGTVHMRGTWVATGFVRFTSFGGPKASRQGGVLELMTMHFDLDGQMCMCSGDAGVPMTLTSLVHAPAGTVGGITVGPFGQPVSGVVAFGLTG
jgi:hypothetical protein